MCILSVMDLTSPPTAILTPPFLHIGREKRHSPVVSSPPFLRKTTDSAGGPAAGCLGWNKIFFDIDSIQRKFSRM
jgi:hypothetical protein